MIVDTSALLAIVKLEPERAAFAAALRASGAFISAATYVELGVVLDRSGLADSVPIDELLQDFGIAITPFTPAQARLAREAHRRYGRGSGHPARLNFGDCFAYALTKERALPLLFKGGDFSRTDVVPAR